MVEPETSRKSCWKDYMLFYEYLYGDEGGGIGGKPPDRMARKLDIMARISKADLLKTGTLDMVAEVARAHVAG